MNTYKLYIRHNGHVVHKYESAVNEFEATAQALHYFPSGSVVKFVQVKQ